MSLLSRTSILKFTDATLGALLCRIAGCGRDGGESVQPVDRNLVRRILVIRPGGLGDMLLLLPVISELKRHFPSAGIDIVCERRNVAVLHLARMESSALVYDSNPMAFLFKLRSKPYDIAIDTEQFHHFSSIFAILSGAKIRVGFKINPVRNPLYTHLVSYSVDGPEETQFRVLLKPFGIPDSAQSFEGSFRDSIATAPDPFPMHDSREPASNGFVAIHPGSSSRLKLWPEDNYVKLATFLAKNHGLKTVLLGGKSERRLCASIAARLSDAGIGALSLAGDADLEKLLQVIGKARCFVGSDSGVAHLAVAAGTPTVVLFGPSDHAKWGHEDKKHFVVRRQLPCSPCFIFGYHKPCSSAACMRGITVESVCEACSRVL